MKVSSFDQESKVSTHKPKLFGLPSSIAGALIGTLFFIILVVLSNLGNWIFLSAALLAPGIWANMVLEAWMDTLPISAPAYDVLSYVIAYVISSIPPATLGAMLFSKKNEVRVIAIFIFVLYFVFSTFVALLAYAIAMD